MSRLLPVTGRQMCKILELSGFVKVHQVGIMSGMFIRMAERP